MNILVTGAAGFIGSAVTKRFLEDGDFVTGVDNINDYYDPDLKFGRLGHLGIEKQDVKEGEYAVSHKFPNFRFIRFNLEDKESVVKLFDGGKYDAVIHLAGQPGVRYSISNPDVYIESNVKGFLNVLEGSRSSGVGHLVFASSSSVYGLNGKTPFSESDGVAHPISLYAATKKSNELMAHAYAHIFGLPVTGLRFFTVYGPWGRPDMSPFLFIEGILKGELIKVFNQGDMLRDFTYIDDIVEGVVRVTRNAPKHNPDWDKEKADPGSSTAPYRIYNIGNQSPTKLLDYIASIERALGKEGRKELLPMQPGDVYQTYADSSALERDMGFIPSTPLEEGIRKTVDWYREYYGHNGSKE